MKKQTFFQKINNFLSKNNLISQKIIIIKNSKDFKPTYNKPQALHPKILDISPTIIIILNNNNNHSEKKMNMKISPCNIISIKIKIRFKKNHIFTKIILIKITPLPLIKIKMTIAIN
jgi:hypothetical protein